MRTAAAALSLGTTLGAFADDIHAKDDDHAQEMEEILVQATRSQRRVQDAPIRVEVLAGEEIEEKLLMRPGNISMMLNETGGLRVQVTSPAIGSANVRIHGMRGRYTQLLADGLPLYGGQAASLGLLQVPPSDLGQVEVIKGASSALFGGQALGGVINLVSKRPGREGGGELIVNATTRDAQDLSAYGMSPLGGGWGGSLLTTYNRQSPQDLDGDDWIDMPGYERKGLRPRLFFDDAQGTSLYLTVGARTEARRGGTQRGGVVSNLEPFQQNQETDRFDVGLVAITDVLESQAAYDSAVVRRIQANGDHDIFFETLSTLSGESYEALDRLSEKLPIVNPNPIDEQEWVSAALARNYGIRTAQEQLGAARRTVRARRSGHLPTIDATVTQVHSVTGSPNFFGADTTDQTVYGLQFNMPLYNGGVVRSRAKEAKALERQAHELLLNQQRTVTRDTRNLYQAVATDVVRVRARLKAIKSSQSALDATETGYEVGTRNIVDVLQAQQRLFSSQFDYADSRYNYVIDLMLLKQVAGALEKADLEELNTYTDPNDQVKRIVLLSNSQSFN